MTGDTEDGRGIVSGVNEKIPPPQPQRHTHTYTHLSTVTGWRCEKRHLQPTCRKKALATPPLSKKHWVGQLLMLNKYTL